MGLSDAHSRIAKRQAFRPFLDDTTALKPRVGPDHTVDGGPSGDPASQGLRGHKGHDLAVGGPAQDLGTQTRARTIPFADTRPGPAPLPSLTWTGLEPRRFRGTNDDRRLRCWCRRCHRQFGRQARRIRGAIDARRRSGRSTARSGRRLGIEGRRGWRRSDLEELDRDRDRGQRRCRRSADQTQQGEQSGVRERDACDYAITTILASGSGWIFRDHAVSRYLAETGETATLFRPISRPGRPWPRLWRPQRSRSSPSRPPQSAGPCRHSRATAAPCCDYRLRDGP